ncbi:MAG: hypothetical protein PHD78_00885 [Bacilli bacterium]|nr:hypothetical protein [Bacilli bacterium]MDD4411018.1 hypothetical protein [Bacilli bacterium]
MLQLDFVEGIIRQLFFFLDKIIYGFIPTLYDFILILAEQKLFTEEAIQTLAGNIYAVLGVFVLFRLAFVLLSAIMDPDKLNDKQKGFPKMLGRVVVALVLIVAIPWVFSYAYKLQAVIINQGLIGKIILGSDHKYDQDPGQQMGEMAFKAFFMCNPNSTGTGNACQNELDEQGFKKAFPPKNPDSETKTASNFDWLLKHLNDETGAVNTNEGEVYKYSYTFGLSTIAGGFILAMLVVFIFDIAVRVVKLGFLQLIAPVAVIGYIEPDGGIFNRWLKMSISTYVNLFVRILAITFVVYVLGVLNTSLIFAEMDSVQAAFVKIFIIFGALMFAKEAPVMLKNMFNLEEGSIGTLNPMKKLGAVPLVGGVAAAGIGFGASGVAKGLSAGGGAIGGGIGSKLRGGSILAGAKSGAAAGAKKIPFTGKPKYGSMIGAALVSGAIGGAAGFTSEAAKEAAIQKAITNAGGDESAMFKNKEVIADYQDMAAKKEAVKQQKEAAARHRNNYSDSQLRYKTSSDAITNANNKYSQASQVLAAAKTARDSAQAKAAKLKQDMDSLKPSDPSIISPSYSAAKREYETYMAANGEYDSANRGYTAAETTFQGAQIELNDVQRQYTDARTNLEDSYRTLQTTTASLETAEKAFSTAETRFNTNLENPSNKKDAETYKTFKTGKNAGRL